MSVETSRVRLAPSPGILVPGCSAGLPSLAAAPHMCFLFLSFSSFFPKPFPGALFGLTSGNHFNFGVRRNTPQLCGLHGVVFFIF